MDIQRLEKINEEILKYLEATRQTGYTSTIASLMQLNKNTILLAHNHGGRNVISENHKHIPTDRVFYLSEVANGALRGRNQMLFLDNATLATLLSDNLEIIRHLKEQNTRLLDENEKLQRKLDDMSDVALMTRSAEHFHYKNVIDEVHELLYSGVLGMETKNKDSENS